jgi:hypothetical protein
MADIGSQSYYPSDDTQKEEQHGETVTDSTPTNSILGRPRVGEKLKIKRHLV